MFFPVKRVQQYELHSFFLKPHEPLQVGKKSKFESIFLLDLLLHYYFFSNLQMSTERNFTFLKTAIIILFFNILVKYQSNSIIFSSSRVSIKCQFQKSLSQQNITSIITSVTIVITKTFYYGHHCQYKCCYFLNLYYFLLWLLLFLSLFSLLLLLLLLLLVLLLLLLLVLLILILIFPLFGKVSRGYLTKLRA